MSRKNFLHPPEPQESPRVGALLRLAWRKIRDHIFEGVQAEGYGDLNPAHLALFRYEGVEGWRPTQLAESMQITKQSVNDLLRHLEDHSYLECRPEPGDKRMRVIRLTAKGRRLEATVRKHAEAAESHLAKELGEEKFREFHGMLLKIIGSPEARAGSSGVRLN